MAVTTTELVHGGAILWPVFEAMKTKTGNSGRAYFAVSADSNNFIQPTRNDGRGQETKDMPGGYYEGLHHALAARGFTCYGSGLSYATGGGHFNSYNSVGLTAATPANAVDPSGISDSTVKAMSFPLSNQSLPGGLTYVSAANVPASTSFDYITALATGSDIDIAMGGSGSSGWNNPFMIGNPGSADIRLNFSVRALGACTVSAGLKTLFTGTSIAYREVFAGASTSWQERSILRTASSGGSYYIMFQTYDYDTLGTTGKSSGPFVISGAQWCVGTVNPADTTTGPGGFAVGCLFTHGGWTLTQHNAEMYAAGVAALAEYMRAARRSAKYFIDVIQFGQNDLSSGALSFKPTDPTAIDASGYASGSGPAQNTGPGFLQNMKSRVAFGKACASAAGYLAGEYMAVWVYHPRSGSPYDPGFANFESALITAKDAGDTDLDVLVICRGTKIMPAQEITNARLYNGQAFTVSSNTLANPTVVTTSAAHGCSTGDLVAFSGTNSVPALEGPYKCTVTGSTTLTVPVNVGTAGTAGTMVKVNGDPAHGQSNLYLMFMAATLDAMLIAGSGPAQPKIVPISWN